MKKVIILSVLFVFSCTLFSCTADAIPAGKATVSAGDPTDPPVGGQGGTLTPPVTPPKP